MKKLIYCMVGLAFASFLSACHTVHGAGQDIEQGGQSIQNAAE